MPTIEMSQQIPENAMVNGDDVSLNGEIRKKKKSKKEKVSVIFWRKLWNNNFLQSKHEIKSKKCVRV